MEGKNNHKGFVVQPRLEFSDLRDKMMYLHFIESANYTKTKECSVGELITSISSLERSTGWSYSIIRGILGRLEERGLIVVETRKQKRGIIVKVVNYARLQSLKNYEKINKEKSKGIAKEKQRDSKEKSKEEESSNPSATGNSEAKNTDDNKEKNEGITKEKQRDSKENHNTITAYITSLNSINSNITLKQYLERANVKSMNLTSTEDVKIFVDFALRINVFPSGVSRKILEFYVDCIRLTRQTCTISANLLANLFDRMSKYSVDQINYALWTHFEQHDDKRENYTLGILRNTKDHEARRGLMKLKNKNGGVSIETSDGHYEKKYEYGF